MVEKNIAIIPARGNSKSIKLKNLIKIENKSLISNTIIKLKKVKEIDHIFVSTESKTIEKEAIKYGAKVIKRPSYLSKDSTTSEDVLLHAIIEIEKLINFENIIFCQCTSPLLMSKDIKKAIKLFSESKIDSIFSGYINKKIIWKKNKDKIYPINSNIKKARKPRQVRNENEFVENGCFYIFKRKDFLKYKNRFIKKIFCYLMDEYKSFEIDSKEDYNFIKLLFKK